MNDLVSEYQQYQEATAEDGSSSPKTPVFRLSGARAAALRLTISDMMETLKSTSTHTLSLLGGPASVWTTLLHSITRQAPATRMHSTILLRLRERHQTMN